MLRYRLRTLLIVLALGPPVLAVVWWNTPEWVAFWRPPKPVPKVTWKPAGGGPRAVSSVVRPASAEEYPVAPTPLDLGE
jgi:hypothetical protein